MVLQNYPSFGFVGFGSKFLYLLWCGKDIVYYANCSFQKKNTDRVFDRKGFESPEF